MRMLARWLIVLVLLSGTAFGQGVGPNPNSLVVGGAIGGNMGPGTINMGGCFINGVACASGGGVTVPTAPLLSGNGSTLGIAPTTGTGSTAVLSGSPTIATPTLTGTTTTAGINDSGGINTTSAGGYQINGQNAVNILGTVGANTATIIGSNAGSLAAANNVRFVTFIGDSVGQNYVGGAGNEVLCAGSLSCGHLTTGGHDVGLGIGALWWETTGNFDTCTGSDTCRNTVGISSLTGTGQGVFDTWFGGPNDAFGQGAMFGNSASLTITGTVAAGETFSGVLTLTGGTGSPYNWTYTTVSGDSVLSVLVGHLCSAAGAIGTVNPGAANGSFNCNSGSVTLAGVPTGYVAVNWTGTATLANITTLTASSTGSEALVIGGGATGNGNSCFGFDCMYGVLATTASSNVGAGQNVLQYVTTAQSDACGGYKSCLSTTSGSQNAAWGFETLLNCTTCSDVAALGFEAGMALTTGLNDVLISQRAGLNLTSGGQNILIGRQSGQLMTINGNSTCVGDLSCSAVVGGANNGNTAFGQSGGATITSGHFNLVLGPNVSSTAGGITSGSANVLIGTSLSCITSSPTSAGEIDLCGSAGPVISGTNTSTASASIVAFAGAAQVGSTTTLALTNGEFGLVKITATGNNPGASGGKIELVCGTTAGTAKLIAYAGTSNTATTVLDNIGAGVTGC